MWSHFGRAGRTGAAVELDEVGPDDRDPFIDFVAWRYSLSSDAKARSVCFRRQPRAE